LKNKNAKGSLKFQFLDMRRLLKMELEKKTNNGNGTRTQKPPRPRAAVGITVPKKELYYWEEKRSPELSYQRPL